MDDDAHGNQPSDCCLRCGIELRLGSDTCYLIKVEAMADPSPPIISTDDGIRQEIEGLFAKMKDLSPQEAMDQVYRRPRLLFCAGHATPHGF